MIAHLIDMICRELDFLMANNLMDKVNAKNKFSSRHVLPLHYIYFGKILIIS